MTGVSYDKATMTIEVDGLDEAARELGGLYRKTPAAAKTAINATARAARKLMLAKAKARYAVNAKGLARLKELKQRQKATNRSLAAELHIKSLRNDLGYFDTRPAVPTHFTGGAWRRGPEAFQGRVLQENSLKRLDGGRNERGLPVGKAFLAEFRSGHIGMVQRVIGSHSEHTVTERGFPRWRTKDGRVEKLVTVGSPSATAMHNTIWPMVEPEAEEILLRELTARARRIVERAELKQVKQ